MYNQFNLKFFQINNLFQFSDSIFRYSFIYMIIIIESFILTLLGGLTYE